MNKVEMIGRLVRDPEVRFNPEKETSVVRFDIAVNTSKTEAIFIPCVCFGKTADIAEKWLNKGSLIGIVGRLSQYKPNNADSGRSYTITEAIVEEITFAEKKKKKKGGKDNGR